MSCKISRRNFMRCAGIGALALASTSLLGGCTKYDAEYGLNETASWTDPDGGALSMTITQAREITADKNTALAQKFDLKTDKTQRYVYLRMEVNNATGERIEMYNRRFNLDFFEGEYTDQKVREYFYRDDEDTDVRTTYPNAAWMVKLEPVLWAYNNGMYLSNGKFGAVCYTGTPGEPRESNTSAEIPTGTSYIDCVGQITENTQVLRIVYRIARKEVNFVIYPTDLA